MDLAGVFRHYASSDAAAVALCVLVDGATLITVGINGATASVVVHTLDRYCTRTTIGTPEICPSQTRHGTGSLGHRVNGLFGSSFTSGSPGHRVIILTWCETRVFPVFEKMPKMQNVHLKC